MPLDCFACLVLKEKPMKQSRYITLSILLLLAAVAGIVPLYAQEANDYGVDIVRFRKVEDGLFRGGQPKEKDFESLQKLGIKTVISLRSDETVTNWEKKIAQQYGMELINLPLDAWREMPEGVPERFLEIVSDLGKRPVFVHCYHGKDRTGTLIALYRVVYHGITPEEAYEEALSLDFAPIFVKYKNFMLNEAITYRLPADD